MKNALSGVILYLALVFILLYSCRSSSRQSSVEEFIPGTYVRASQHEFGKEYDTIVVAIQNAGAHQYKMERRWKYERLLDGNPIEPEYKVSQTSGTYNGEHKLLEESETGNDYSFDPAKGVLFIDATPYKKIRL